MKLYTHARIFTFLLTFFVLFMSHLSFGAEPVLHLQFKTKSIHLSRPQLLARPDVTTVSISDPVLKQEMHYTTVPVAHLLLELLGQYSEPDAMLIFKCIDGFSGPLNQARALNQDTKKPIALLAIEDPKKPWPTTKIASVDQDIGPFYLIWTQPKGAAFFREEWPFQLTALEVKPSLAASYPKLMPDVKIAEQHPIRRGLKTFTENCFQCHKLNRQGLSDLGPDLNDPMNPTEYLKSDAMLKKLIRDPQALRTWSNSKMTGFTPEHLTDAQISDLIQYLKHMANQRKRLTNEFQPK